MKGRTQKQKTDEIFFLKATIEPTIPVANLI